MNLGIGVMIQHLFGSQEEYEATKHEGKIIKTIDLNEERLILNFKDKTKLELRDAGQSCCEARYMTTDDELTDFHDSKFANIEVREITEKEEDWETHEIAFVLITTSKGVFTIETHNEHNGYYGGFALQVSD